MDNGTLTKNLYSRHAIKKFHNLYYKFTQLLCNNFLLYSSTCTEFVSMPREACINKICLPFDVIQIYWNRIVKLMDCG